MSGFVAQATTADVDLFGDAKHDACEIRLVIVGRCVASADSYANVRKHDDYGRARFTRPTYTMCRKILAVSLFLLKHHCLISGIHPHASSSKIK